MPYISDVLITCNISVAKVNIAINHEDASFHETNVTSLTPVVDSDGEKARSIGDYVLFKVAAEKITYPCNYTSQAIEKTENGWL